MVIDLHAFKVELPVAEQSPCRSLRAVFPHRAPQLGCAVALALCLEQTWGTGLCGFYDFGFGDVQRLPHGVETLPVVALLFNATIEHAVERMQGGIEE